MNIAFGINKIGANNMAQQQKSTIDGLKRIFDKLLADRNNRDLLLELMKEIEKFDQNEVKLLKPEQRDAASATTSSYNNVMVVGPTAAGKSSLINTLLGKSLTVEFEKGSPETRLVKLLASSDGQVIGTGHNSETAYCESLDR
ncbi:MAG UNVERIFIED_CONTAM: 50S ribosome-binding GTPase [Rickettsiaceae bacterium]